MKISLYSKLAVIFISISLISIIIISIIANISTGIMFKKYVYEKQNRRNQVIINILIDSYKDNSFDPVSLDEVSMYAMMDNLNVKIRDNAGKIIWNANYLGHHDIMNYTNRNNVNDLLKDKYIENEIPILKDNQPIGTMIIGYNGEYALSYHDIGFINSFNRWLLFSGVISALVALLISTMVSRQITVPIVKATEIAHSIKEGDLSKRLDIETGTSEVSELVDTINHLAKSLDKQDMLRKQLTSDVAHELRTPLATLQSHTEALLDGVWKPTKDRIESIHEEIVRMSKLVKDIEKLSQIENAVTKLDISKFNLSELVSTVIRNFEAEAKNKGIDLIMNNVKAVEVSADKDKLYQVMVNLISNAIKYAESGGRVTLDIEDKSHDVEIRIKDTGIGIEEEHLPYVFERFYRVDSSRTRMTGGSGIGLAIVKSIVKAHHGDVKVTSRKGVGTEFIVTIPKC